MYLVGRLHFIVRLIDNGFDDRIILEVPTDAFLDAGGLDTVTASLQALRTWIQGCRAATSAARQDS